MSERKLGNRKRRASKGKAIRVSNLVYETLDMSRRQRSWDCMFRRMLGLPDRAGRNQALVEGMLETTTGLFLLKLEQTAWPELEETAFKMAEAARRRNKQPTVSAPLRMRELR